MTQDVGHSLLIATSNCPWRISAAMLERFTVIPVLQPLKEDYPAIVASLARHVDHKSEANPSNPAIVEAAEIFHDKGASPRNVRNALSQARFFNSSLSDDVIITAAKDVAAVNDRVSSVYADLWALRTCALRSYLPWNGDGSYAFPAYLNGVVEPKTGDIDRKELYKRIEESRPYANV